MSVSWIVWRNCVANGECVGIGESTVDFLYLVMSNEVIHPGIEQSLVMYSSAFMLLSQTSNYTVTSFSYYTAHIMSELLAMCDLP